MSKLGRKKKKQKPATQKEKNEQLIEINTYLSLQQQKSTTIKKKTNMIKLVRCQKSVLCSISFTHLTIIITIFTFI